MPYTAIWIHAVWATYQRHPWLTSAIRAALHEHLREQAKRQHIRLTDANGFTDHVHVLFALAPDQTLAKAIQLLKGESSHWLNQQGLASPGPFRWQAEYWAGSVSPSGLARVRAYIAGQETHHQSISFAEECEQLFKGLGIMPQRSGSADPSMG